MLILVKSTSAVFVTVCSKFMLICNRFNARRGNSRGKRSTTFDSRKFSATIERSEMLEISTLVLNLPRIRVLASKCALCEQDKKNFNNFPKISWLPFPLLRRHWRPCGKSIRWQWGYDATDICSFRLCKCNHLMR